MLKNLQVSRIYFTVAFSLLAIRKSNLVNVSYYERLTLLKKILQN